MVENSLLTPAQVADLLHVSPVTIRHWALNAKLDFVTTPGGHRRFRVEDIERFVANNLKGNDRRVSSILIVDDDIRHCRFLVDFFAEAPLPSTTAVAHNGFEAADLLHKIQPDVVFLDLMMPGMDGFEVCEYIKKESKTQHIPVIAMTGFPSQDNIDRIMEAGAEVCYSKPIDPHLLATKVTDILTQPLLNLRKATGS